MQRTADGAQGNETRFRATSLAVPNVFVLLIHLPGLQCARDGASKGTAAFVGALKIAGYDGPLTCEPMNQTLDAENAASQTFAAMRQTVFISLHL